MKQHSKRIFQSICAAVMALTCTTLPTMMTAQAANLLLAEFETTNDSFTGRGNASVAWTSDEAFTDKCSLFVSDRSSTWNGASRDASSILSAGNTYNISCAVLQKSGEPVEMKFSLQYSGSNGTSYDQIALETVESGEWTVLSNTAYTVPSGASDCSIYVETTESLTDFYIDTVKVTGAPASIKQGDANGDMSVNVSDAVCLMRFLTAQDVEVEMGADFNKDNKINAVDLSLLKTYLLTPKQSSQVEGDWDNYKETASTAMLKVYQDSILNMGNTSRIRDKIAKAQSGEQVTIGYLGGSITAGGSSSTTSKCFANLSHQYFSETFGTGNNVKMVNAGLAGTSSVVGNLRVDNDIFSKNCDIIFIEFAVNDQGSSRFQKSFDSLVKKCLMQENEPAVIVVTLCQQSGDSNQDWMATVAKNYDVPVISGKNAIMNAIKAGTMSWSDYGSGDNIHPGDGGHKMIADCIAYYYRQALRSENESDELVINEKSVYGTEYATARVVSINELKNLNTGSWSKGTNNSSYPNGFTFSKNGNSPLTFTVEGKGIMLLFQSNANSSMGTVDVSINGSKKGSVASNLQWTWGGLDGDVAYYSGKTETMNVSISMQNQSTNFVLYGIAVIE